MSRHWRPVALDGAAIRACHPAAIRVDLAFTFVQCDVMKARRTSGSSMILSSTRIFTNIKRAQVFIIFSGSRAAAGGSPDSCMLHCGDRALSDGAGRTDTNDDSGCLLYIFRSGKSYFVSSDQPPSTLPTTCAIPVGKTFVEASLDGDKDCILIDDSVKDVSSHRCCPIDIPDDIDMAFSSSSVIGDDAVVLTFSLGSANDGTNRGCASGDDCIKRCFSPLLNTPAGTIGNGAFSSAFKCILCSRPLTLLNNKDDATIVKNLPSEGWLDLVDCWSCHDNEFSAIAEKAVLEPAPGIVLSGISYYYVFGRDYAQNDNDGSNGSAHNQDGSGDHRDLSVKCPHCSTIIGHITPQNHIRLSKFSLLPFFFEDHPLEWAERLLISIVDHHIQYDSCFHYSIQSISKKINIQVLNPSVILYCRSPHQLYRPAAPPNTPLPRSRSNMQHVDCSHSPRPFYYKAMMVQMLGDVRTDDKFFCIDVPPHVVNILDDILAFRATTLSSDPHVSILIQDNRNLHGKGKP